ncbi:response regulator [Asticcacaulis biprosthecium C19]|uniref:Response regulator n=1 Tax=Asticcacaulis biprosthecium C19 TaxID=715226 RepID=F4QT56_9CAUL|nr:response regulator [Asticcacaulis biprosthecium]EGF89926.1 response regulator [Asticcacaulis biprosthecium C19]
MNLGSVLILDQNREQAQRISTMLGAQKWTSVLSFDQRMAMRQLKANRFHLLLFDAYSDGIAKAEVLGNLRAESHDAPLALMSNHVSKGQLMKSAADAAHMAGADFVLPKPFNQDKLKTLLNDTNAYHRKRMKEHHILVVEDDPELRGDVCRVLKQVGYKVAWAANMEDAFFDHNLGMIDVVVTAVLIPGIGGIEGTAQIKRDWEHVRVVAASEGVDDKITAVHVLAAAKAAGADALLPKPYTMRDMLLSVASVIRAKDAPEEVTTAAQDAIDAIFAR